MSVKKINENFKNNFTTFFFEPFNDVAVENEILERIQTFVTLFEVQ